MSEKNELIQAWIDKADHDLDAAKLIYLHIPKHFDTISFHCQEADEKYLKALLINYNIEFQKSHNLMYLLDLLSCRIEIKEETYNNAILLNGFSVGIRYPDKQIFLTKEELDTSIQIAQDFRLLVQKYIKINT
jgi:HEPN domain-containing protein